MTVPSHQIFLEIGQSPGIGTTQLLRWMEHNAISPDPLRFIKAIVSVFNSHSLIRMFRACQRHSNAYRDASSDRVLYCLDRYPQLLGD
jgi:hypothetical protein